MGKVIPFTRDSKISPEELAKRQAIQCLNEQINIIDLSLTSTLNFIINLADDLAEEEVLDVGQYVAGVFHVFDSFGKDPAQYESFLEARRIFTNLCDLERESDDLDPEYEAQLVEILALIYPDSGI